MSDNERDDDESELNCDEVIAACQQHLAGDKHALDDLMWRWDEVEELAVEVIALCSAGEPRSRTYGIDSCSAYDFGADFYCIIRDSRDIGGDITLIDVVLKSMAEKAFRDAQSDFIVEYVSGGGPPSEFSLRDDTDPALLHEFATALTGTGTEDDLARLANGLELVTPWPAPSTTRWTAAVEALPAKANEDVPPELAWVDDEDVDMFDAWLDRTQFLWRDTKMPVSRLEAQALWLACVLLG